MLVENYGESGVFCWLVGNSSKMMFCFFCVFFCVLLIWFELVWSVCPLSCCPGCPVVLLSCVSANLKKVTEDSQSSHVKMTILRRPVPDLLQMSMVVVDVEAVQVLGANIRNLRRWFLNVTPRK